MVVGLSGLQSATYQKPTIASEAIFRFLCQPDHFTCEVAFVACPPPKQHRNHCDLWRWIGEQSLVTFNAGTSWELFGAGWNHEIALIACSHLLRNQLKEVSNNWLTDFGNDCHQAPRYIKVHIRGPTLDFPLDPRRMLCNRSENGCTNSNF